ncbi:HEPN domain-containing protein [Serratia marcescens]|uniref:HEPN domain-containing protein n=1 Tax=Serratia marcescens TaxID=615 RepID=UPI00313EB88E
MAQSTRFSQLEARLNELKNHLLPDVFSETGDYSLAVLDMAKGYRLLSHAEFESYIEDIAKEIVIEAIRKWKDARKPSVTIVSFLAAYHSSWSTNDEQQNTEIIELSRGRLRPKESLLEAINIAYNQFLKKIGSNNGIKSTNFKTLILPTGIDIDQLDSELLIKLDNYGSKRGEIAHNSSLRVTHQLNPQDELAEVTYLLECLKKLDEKLSELKSSIL